MGELVIIRHGQSEANAKNVFAGWVDTKLTDKGKQQARDAGNILRQRGFRPDIVFTSTLSRAIDTAKIALAAMGTPDATLIQDAALMERHYGGLTGMDKTEAKAKFGEEQFLQYRRSYDIPPLPMDKSHPAHPDHPSTGEKVVGMPPGGKGTESLADVVERVRPFFQQEILPRMARGEKVLIAAHGNSLRALSMLIEAMSSEAVKSYEIENGIPIRYAIDVPKQGLWTFTREELV